jgi:hypothetical protein
MNHDMEVLSHTGDSRGLTLTGVYTPDAELLTIQLMPTVQPKNGYCNHGTAKNAVVYKPIPFISSFYRYLLVHPNCTVTVTQCPSPVDFTY